MTSRSLVSKRATALVARPPNVGKTNPLHQLPSSRGEVIDLDDLRRAMQYGLDAATLVSGSGPIFIDSTNMSRSSRCRQGRS